MTEFIKILDSRMETPKCFGWFHLLAVAIIIAMTAFLCVKFKNCSDKTYRRIIWISWIVIVILEIYKEFNFCVGISDGGQISATYQWFIFPFQFCSTPLYIFPLIAFLPDCATRRGCIYFLATFILFAGLTVFVYPGQVFTSTIGINIQTMVHHGAQVFLGIFTAVRFRHKFSLRKFLSSVIVFSALSAIALVLNEILFKVIPAGETCNLFFISRHYTSTLPILCNIQGKVPYIAFLLIYLLGFSLAAFIVYALVNGIVALAFRKETAK